MDNLQEIDQEQALDLARFFIKAKQNVFLFGQRGIGKSQISLQAALDCGMKINYINLSVIERPDLMGYPDMQANGDVITFKSPYFLPKLKDNQIADTVLIFDEIDKVEPDITAPLLEILQFKKINGQPVNVAACILTGNLIEENSYSNKISSALLDRGAKYKMSFKFDKWLEWARTNYIHDLILGFLVSHPEFTCGKIEETNAASPSPRGWTLASDALFKAKELKIMDLETISNIISGFVGIEAGYKFKTWYEYYRKFEPVILSMLESGICSIDYQELIPTEQIVFCITACHFAKIKFLSDSKKKPNYRCIESLCHFIKEQKISEEICIFALKNSFSFAIITDKKYKLYQNKMFFELGTRLKII